MPRPEKTITVETLRNLTPHEIKCRCGNGGIFAGRLHDEDCPRREVDDMLAALATPSQQEPRCYGHGKMQRIEMVPAEGELWIFAEDN